MIWLRCIEKDPELIEHEGRVEKGSHSCCVSQQQQERP